jgi:hypothetical protein
MSDQIATGAMVVGLVALFIPLASARASGPSLALSPASGASGSSVHLSGTTFSSRLRLQVSWDGVTSGMPTAQVDRTGRFKTTIVVPVAVSGSHMISVAQVVSKADMSTVQVTATLADVSSTVIAFDPKTIPADPFAAAVPGATPLPDATPAPGSTSDPGAAPAPGATLEPSATADPGSTLAPGSSPAPGATPAPVSTPSPTPTVAPTPTATRAPRARPTATPAPTAPPPPPPPPGAGFVVRSGTRLTLAGTPYRFDGLNMYTAVQAPCWWQEGLAQGLTAIGSGQEVARVFAFQRTATTNGVRDWRYMDAALATFKAHGVRVIWVLTDQWNGQPCTDSATDRTLGWYQTGYKTTVEGATTYRDWVAQVVTRYRNDPTILAWQLVNEGEARNANGSCSEASATAALRSFADDVGGLVQSLDANHLVSLGTTAGECGSNEADYQHIYSSASIDLCDYHDYGFATSPMSNTDPYNGLQASINRCHAIGKPLMVGRDRHPAHAPLAGDDRRAGNPVQREIRRPVHGRFSCRRVALVLV